jgi:hypothetical protein
VAGIRGDVNRIQADVKSLGSILERIEVGVLRSQEQQEEREQRSKQSPVAIATVIITVMSMLVGGAWISGSNIARLDERSLWLERNQERVEQHLWDARQDRGGPHGEAPASK